MENEKRFARLKWALLEAMAVDPELSHLDFRIATRLIRYLHHRRKVAFPGVAILVREVRANERSVRRSLDRLVRSGWWLKPGQGGGRGRASVYMPNFAKLETGAPESGFLERMVNEAESDQETRAPESVNPDSNDRKTPAPESSQTYKESKKKPRAPATSPPPTPGAPATTPSLGENIDASPGTTVDASKKKLVAAQVPNIGAKLRDRVKKAEVRQRASTDLHAFLIKALGEAGYAEWVAATSPETEALLAKHLEVAPLEGKARRQHELRLLRMIEGGGAAVADDVAGEHHHDDERDDGVDQAVAAAGGAA